MLSPLIARHSLRHLHWTLRRSTSFTSAVGKVADIACAADAGDFTDRALQIIAFRTFSNIATWDGVCSELAPGPRLADLASGAFKRVLDKGEGVQRGTLHWFLHPLRKQVRVLPGVRRRSASSAKANQSATAS